MSSNYPSRRARGEAHRPPFKAPKADDDFVPEQRADRERIAHIQLSRGRKELCQKQTRKNRTPMHLPAS
jgi:hypothetical protein